MKKSNIIILGVVLVMAMSACVFFEASGSGREAGGFEAVFDRNGFALVNDDGITTPPVILENSAGLDSYIQAILANMDWLNDAAHKMEMTQHINDFYARYDNAFFDSHRLVIAHIDSGSGSLSFSLNNLSKVDNVLVVNINRYTPAIQTMDYNRHIMFLSVARDYAEFDSVKINLETIHINR